ncbi:glycosyltransferase [Ralstonia pseudosolanacearum]
MHKKISFRCSNRYQINFSYIIISKKFMLRKRILFAWELGANLGHLARDIPVAEQLRKLGHDVTFAARDLRVAQEVLAPRGFRFLQAPRPHTAGHRKQPPANYSGILLAGGYGDALNLVGSVGGWAALLDVTQTDVVVINHAPTAALAARALAIPAVITCIGFELPPNVEPLPSFRPWETRSIDELRQADATVLGNINIVLQNYSKAPLRRVADLFSELPAILTTFPELDHYGHRPCARYVGPLSGLSATTEANWPTDDAKRIFAYLRPTVPGFEHLLAALQESGACVLCIAPGISQEIAHRFASQKVKILARPVALGKALPDADLAVVYGTGTMADALLAGVPLLMVPQVIEQVLAARRIEELGAGLLWGAPRTAETAKMSLRAALGNDSLIANARAFAQKHRDFSPHQAIDEVVSVICEAAAEH